MQSTPHVLHVASLIPRHRAGGDRDVRDGGEGARAGRFLGGESFGHRQSGCAALAAVAIRAHRFVVQ